MTQRRTWIVNGVLIVLLGGAGFGIYQAFSPKTGDAQATVRTSAVTRSDVTETVSAAGTVASAYTANANFSSQGKVTAIYVAVGDHVGAGQKLATIDSAQAEKQLQVAKDNLAVAQENLTNAENTPAQSTTSLQAKVDQAELDVQNAQDAVNGTVLTAPGAGTVTAINGAVGQQSSAGSSSSAQQSSSSSTGNSQNGQQSSSSASTSSSSSGTSGFITITDMNTLVVDTSVAEIDVSKVKPGQQAEVTVNALPTTPVKATVASVALTPSSSGNVVSYDTKLNLTSPPEGLRPGQSASVVITVADAPNALSVPAAAVRTNGTTSTVMVQQNGIEVPRQVQLGVRGESTVQVTSGLSEGDRVVLTGTQQQSSTNGTRGGTGGTGGFGGTGGPPGGFGGNGRQAGIGGGGR